MNESHNYQSPKSHLEESASHLYSKDSRNMAALVHLLTLIFGFIPAVIFYILKSDDHYVKKHSIESINLSISYFIYTLVSAVLSLVLVGILFLFILSIAWIVLNIIAAIKANEGDYYRFPFIIRFIK